MRAAEERYPGYPETAPELMERAGAAVAREVLQLVPGRAPRRRRLWGWRKRRRRADRSEDPAGRGPRCGRDDSGRAGRRHRRCAVRHRVQRRAAGGSGGDDPADQRGNGARRLRGYALRCRRVHRRGHGRGRPRHVTVTFHGLKAGLAVAPGRFHTGEAVIADIGLEPAVTDLKLVTRDSCRSCRASGPRTTSTPPARYSSSAARRG